MQIIPYKFCLYFVLIINILRFNNYCFEITKVHQKCSYTSCFESITYLFFSCLVVLESHVSHGLDNLLTSYKENPKFLLVLAWFRSKIIISNIPILTVVSSPHRRMSLSITKIIKIFLIRGFGYSS